VPPFLADIAPANLGWMLAAAAFGLLLLYAFSVWVQGAWNRLRLRRRAARARRGEDEAADVLRAAGYRVDGREVEHTWEVGLDGERVPIGIRADYLVSRGGRAFVAEVKTGRSAPQLLNRATRRQLLEYRLAYPVHGVLLVDMEKRRVREVVFPLAPARRPVWPMALTFLMGAAMGAGLALWWAWH